MSLHRIKGCVALKVFEKTAFKSVVAYLLLCLLLLGNAIKYITFAIKYVTLGYESVMRL